MQNTEILDAQTNIENDVFTCSEETDFYAYCIESLVTKKSYIYKQKDIIEFGSGDGTAVIKAIKNSNFSGLIHGFEINPKAVDSARRHIDLSNTSKNFVIYNRSLFDTEIPESSVLISNPPYLPAQDDNIYMPELHGGTNGITLSKELLDLDFEKVMLLVASYSDPIGLISYARELGYKVAQFNIASMPFGYYSSDPKVMSRINEMEKENKAFFTANGYLLAGVLFDKGKVEKDLSSELLLVLTSI